MQKIGVLGAGTMGAGIAQGVRCRRIRRSIAGCFGCAGERRLEHYSKNLDRQVAKGTLPEIEHQAILGRIQAATDLTAVADCDLVVEAIIESMDIKKVVFGELDAVCKPSTSICFEYVLVVDNRNCQCDQSPGASDGYALF